jgi:transposase
MPYRRPSPLVLSEAERDELEDGPGDAAPAQSLALRARIVLRSGDGLSNKAIAHELGIAKHTGRQMARALRPAPERRSAGRAQTRRAAPDR